MSTSETSNEAISHAIPFLRFLISMPPRALEEFCHALMECSGQIRADVLQMFEIAEDESLSVDERGHALRTIVDQLHLIPDDEGRFGMDLARSEELAASNFPALAYQVGRMNLQESEFADRLRHLMKTKHITQKELAARIDCTQPAISQMLNRKCRPQRKTLNKIATALAVDVRELWPDLEVSEYLDSVAEFQQDDRIMTEPEAVALRDTSQPRSKLKGQPLPSRKK
ncbi:MAG: helix-turn-helix transcriptional regulator [Fuerstiella sp.]